VHLLCWRIGPTAAVRGSGPVLVRLVAELVSAGPTTVLGMADRDGAVGCVV